MLVAHTDEAHAFQEISLNEGATTIGSAESNVMVLKYQGVSYYHAMIITLNRMAYIHDVGGLSGVFVNGKSVQYQVLRCGDRVNIGHFCFEVSNIE